MRPPLKESPRPNAILSRHRIAKVGRGDRVRIRNPRDFWAGLLYIAFGLAGVVIASNYPVGTTSRMGPGYFPRGLGFLLMLIGLILTLRALRLDGPPIAFPTFKPLLIVLGSVTLFGLAAPHLGIAIATVILIIASSMASHEFRWKEAIIASVVMSVFTLAAFAWGLQLQLPVWPALFG